MNISSSPQAREPKNAVSSAMLKRPAWVTAALFCCSVLIVTVLILECLPWLDLLGPVYYVSEEGQQAVVNSALVVARANALQLALGKMSQSSATDIQLQGRGFPSGASTVAVLDQGSMIRPWAIIIPALVLFQGVMVLLVIRGNISLRKASSALLVVSSLAIIILIPIVRIDYMDDIMANAFGNAHDWISAFGSYYNMHEWGARINTQSHVYKSIRESMAVRFKTQTVWPFWASGAAEACLVILAVFLLSTDRRIRKLISSLPLR